MTDTTTPTTWTDVAEVLAKSFDEIAQVLDQVKLSAAVVPDTAQAFAMIKVGERLTHITAVAVYAAEDLLMHGADNLD